MESGSDDDLSQVSLQDKKNLLLRMLEKQTGGAKTNFNFEEDDI